jgi:LDH2 family malate/lactate/ureidoglycolate dehydrogenase
MTERRIGATTLAAWCGEVLTANGVGAAQARAVTANLIWSELVGRSNFGLGRLPVFVKRLKHGVIKGDASPRWLAPELLDGDRAFGHYAAELAMMRAIAMARRQGMGAVAVRNSNFFGAAAYYAKLACDAGMIGFAFSNSFPKVAAHGGHLPVLGTNPFAFAAPRHGGDHLLVDMATSALAGSTVRSHIEAGTPLPAGLAVDAQGRPITDPEQVEQGALLPFGGPKGFGLALMVEVLAGILSGAGIGAGVGSMYNDYARAANNGHFLMAIDISRFMERDAFSSRLEMLVAMVKTSAPGGGVLIPGETRWAMLRENRANGIPVGDALMRTIASLSLMSGVTPIKVEAA